MMKNTIIKFGLLAVAATAVLACNKTEGLEPADQSSRTHSVTFNLSQPETKTLIVPGVDVSTFKWSSDDASRFTVTENDEPGTGIALAFTDENAKMTLSATFPNTAASEYTYKAIFAANRTAGNPAVPAAQTASATAFDPNADILFSKPLTFDAVQTSLNMQFARPVAIHKMTLKGLSDGETISSIVITSDKDIVGNYDVDTDTWTGESNEITLTTSEVVSSNEITVYFISMPVDGAIFTVKAISDATVYTKTFGSTIDIKENMVTIYDVTMAGTPKATPTLSFTNATYSFDSSDYDTFSGQVATADPDVAEITGNITYAISGDAIYSAFDTATGAITLTGAAGTVTITASYAGGENYLPAADVSYTIVVKGPATLSFSGGDLAFSTTDTDSVVGNTATATPDETEITSAITYAISGDVIYSAFDTATGEVTLNGAVGTATVTASFAGSANYEAAADVSYDITVSKAGGVTINAFAESSFSLTTLNYSSFTGQTTTATPSVSLTYEMTGDAIGSVDASSGEVSLNGAVGTATVTASFPGDATYEAAATPQSYTITVSKVPVNITAFGTANIDCTTLDYNTVTGQTTTVDQSVTLTYAIDDDTMGSVAADGTVTLSGKAGTAAITASFDGDGTYEAATSQSYTITVSKVAVNIAAFDPTSLVYYTAAGSTDTDITAFQNYSTCTGQTTSADQSVTLTYALSGNAIGTVNSSGVVSLNGTAGTATITASFDGDDKYLAATPQSYTITVKTLKKSTYTVTTSSTSSTFTDSGKGASWTISHTGGAFTCQGTNASNRYLQVTSQSGYTQAASSLKFTTSGYSGVEIKRVGVTASGSTGSQTSYQLQATLSVNGTALGTAHNLNNSTAAPPTVITYDDNTGALEGDIEILLSRGRPSSQKYIYFKALFVVYAE